MRTRARAFPRRSAVKQGSAASYLRDIERAMESLAALTDDRRQLRYDLDTDTILAIRRLNKAIRAAQRTWDARELY